MPVTYKKTVAMLEGNCSIEEAEGLLEWLLEHPKAKINLKNLEHPHAAVIQVLMAIKPEVSSYPDAEDVAAWISPVLSPE